MENSLYQPAHFEWLRGNIVELNPFNLFIKFRVPSHVTISLKQCMQIFAGAFKKEFPDNNVYGHFGELLTRGDPPYYYLSGRLLNKELFDIIKSIYDGQKYDSLKNTLCGPAGPNTGIDCSPYNTGE